MYLRCLPFALASCAMFTGCEPIPTASNQPLPSAATPAESPAESVKAQVGVGAKGRSLDNETGVGKMISSPVSTLFAVKEHAAFDIQIPHALNLFRATEGRFPKSHEEFMTRIIKENQIKLPELPAGMVYRFNTELGELWVGPDTGNANPPVSPNP